MTRAMIRIGVGYDVHALAIGRPLVIGGVTIDWHCGLVGHSDADVLLHAICDASLGAAGLGDLGAHFPSADPRYKNIDSRELLRSVADLLRQHAWQIGNVDCSVVAEQPKLTAHVAAMRANIANDLKVDAQQINIKATTTDGLGYIGQQKGIAAHAVVLITRG